MRRLLIVAALAGAAFVIALAANAHLGGSGSCQLGSPYTGWNYNNAAQWGCGGGGIDGPQTAWGSVDDKQHDHSCVYMWYKNQSGTWKKISQIKSCGNPYGGGAVNVGEDIYGLRIYVQSQYIGTRYATLCTSPSDCANP